MNVTFAPDAVDRLLYWITEREAIRLKRATGSPPPWTEDPILRDWSFCNVRREHDRVTRWIAENWRGPHADDPDLWFAMCVARLVNLPDTLVEIGYPVPWDADRFLGVMAARRERGTQHYGGAYKIGTDQAGGDKPSYQVTKVFRPLWSARERMRPRPGMALAEYMGMLLDFHGLGSFLAAQVVADLKYVEPLRGAPDWATFAASGPGSKRGLNRVLGRPVDAPWDEYRWLTTLRQLREAITPRIDAIGLGDLHAQDLQNCLCEFDKHERTRLGDGEPKRRFQATEVGMAVSATPSAVTETGAMPVAGPEPVRAALASLDSSPLWVAWRYKHDSAHPDKPPRKVPYDPATGDEAKSNNPATWGTRAAAEDRARKMVNGSGAGIGINLADLGDGTALAGIDLDTCRDPEGRFTDWADEVMRRIGSYAEVSPSGTGAKVFFLLRAEDREALLADIREAGEEREGRKWSLGGVVGDHAPAIEVYLGRRYFTVTGQVEAGMSELRLVEPDAVRWLIREAGPALAAQGRANGGEGTGGRGGHDQTRSAVAFRRGCELRRAGKSYEEMAAAMLADPETADWTREKGQRDGARELRRIFEKADRAVAGPPYQIDAAAPLATGRLFRDVRFDHDATPMLWSHRGAFFAWNGAAYPEVEDRDVRARLYGFLGDECVVPVKDKDAWRQVPVKPNATMVNNVVDALRAATLLPSVIAPPAWLEQVPDLEPQEIIACANGLLHLPTGDLLPHTPTFFNHNALPFAFDRTAPEPGGWLSFLRQLWGFDTSSIEALQEIFGYCLGADTSQQKMFMIVGPKRSGKGTIARVLTALVGAENAVAPTLAGIGTNFGLAPLIGKRVAIVSDARLGGAADQATIAERLLSITGEDGITIDRKYREAWTGRLGARFLVLTNELPRLADASGALASRFIVLVLTESFYGHEDPGLTNRLLGELPGVLNWAIEGWRRLRERGHFVQPAAAHEAIAELEDLGSPIGAFLRDRCKLGAGLEVKADDLFRAWKAWCDEQGRDYSGDRASFGRNLRAAAPGVVRRQTREGRLYEGIGLKSRGE